MTRKTNKEKSRKKNQKNEEKRTKTKNKVTEKKTRKKNKKIVGKTRIKKINTKREKNFKLKSALKRRKKT